MLTVPKSKRHHLIGDKQNYRSDIGANSVTKAGGVPGHEGVFTTGLRMSSEMILRDSIWTEQAGAAKR